MTTNDTSPDERPGERGILAPAARLDRWLDGVLVVLIVTCAIRYVGGHGLDASAAFVLGGAGLLVAAYAARPLVRHRAGGPTAWVVVVVALWTGLTLVAPSFAWTAVPIAFAVLQVLPFTYAAGVVVLMTVVVSVAWTRLTDAST